MQTTNKDPISASFLLTHVANAVMADPCPETFEIRNERRISAAVSLLATPVMPHNMLSFAGGTLDNAVTSFPIVVACVV